MLPVIAIVGRPNVGKSTLFNQLTRSRQALVADLPGVTRDRQYGEASLDDRTVLVVDTGGIGDVVDDTFAIVTSEQTNVALEEADVILFVVDARLGCVPSDMVIADQLRRYKKPVIVVMNKADDRDQDAVSADFYELGFGAPCPIAARRRRGVATLIQTVLSHLPVEAPVVLEPAGIKIAVVGRPNVGKSTLVNRLLGENRVIVSDQPGTTRGSIAIPFQSHGKSYVLIDTAGIRRRVKIREKIEKFSVIQSIQVVSRADVVIFVVDAQTGVTEQDVRLLQLIIESGTALTIAVNKWDGLSQYERDRVRASMDLRLTFVDFARRYFISALCGTGVGDLYRAINEAYKSAYRELSTAQLTKALEAAVIAHAPPLVQGRRVRLRYAHFGARRPLTIVVHGKQTADLPGSYGRYLANTFRETFSLVGVPVHIKFKTDVNPYQRADDRRQRTEDRR